MWATFGCRRHRFWSLVTRGTTVTSSSGGEGRGSGGQSGRRRRRFYRRPNKRDTRRCSSRRGRAHGLLGLAREGVTHRLLTTAAGEKLQQQADRRGEDAGAGPPPAWILADGRCFTLPEKIWWCTDICLALSYCILIRTYG